jgi:hypothetical protein
MAFRANRRRLCALIALLFALGSGAHAYASTNALMAMSATAMEDAGQDEGMGGMDCGGKDKATHAACVAMCASAVAIVNDAVAIPLVVAVQDVEAVPVTMPPGLGMSPEPPPPTR